ncbi:MFS transporter [Gorillibacterium timonense]|uniref:MFS transporter n=1 Tax=Gorillibacterium timonense TaxID=1689269 RepID=UPI000A9F7FD7|nr:MFS transporter [Gorillibacterium timonense]
MEKERLWTKDFLSITIVNFVLWLSMYLLLVQMAPYAKQHYHASTSMAGLVASIFVIGSLIGRLFAGKQINAIGSKRMLICSILLTVVFIFFYLVQTNLEQLMIIRLLHGIGVGMSTTATGTIVAQVIPRARNGEGIGYFSLSSVLATAIGPFIGIALAHAYGFRSIFLFSLAVGILSLAAAFLVNSPSPLKSQAEEGAEKSKSRFRLSDYLEVRALPIALVTLVIGFCYSGVLSFLTVYAAEIDLVDASSFFFLVYALSALLSRPVTGKLLDRRGGNVITYPAFAAFAVGMLLFSQAHSGFVILAAAVFIGLGYGNLQSCTQSLALKVTPHHRMGLANSTYFIFLDLGIGLGPFVLGYLVPIVGYRGLFLSIVAVILLGALLYHPLHGKRDKELLRSQTV